MESYQIQNLTFAYPGGRAPALRNLTFSVGAGEFVCLVGPSGCGKTTLLRRLKPSLAPHGQVTGEVFFEGVAAGSLDARTDSGKIGFVMQCPDSQIVTDKVWHELAFGLESLGYDTPSIRLRVAETASFFGIGTWFHKSVTELSGGQKQLLCLASVMAMQPSVLILDEPTSQLDPIAATEFLSLIGKINRELGVTVIMTEHRLEEVFPLSDRVIAMDGGRIIADGTPAEIGMALRERGHGMFRAMPVPMRVYAAVKSDLPCPVTVRQGRAWLDLLDISPRQPLMDRGMEPRAPEGAAPAVWLDGVWFRYEKQQPDVMRGLCFQAYAGEITAILGGNGTGKTTLLSLISGANRPYRGRALVQGAPAGKGGGRPDGGVGMLPQNPQTLFVCRTVEEDLWEVLSDLPIDRAEKGRRVRDAARLCHLEGLLPVHPYDLSGGEQQRAALAKVLLLRPRVLLLDEPTKGLDAQFKQILAGILRGLAATGAAVILVSHDIEFCAEYASRCAMLFDGSVASTGRPRAFFSGNSFYTTAASRMARHLWPEAITVGDLVGALGGDLSGLVLPSGDDTAKDLRPEEKDGPRTAPPAGESDGSPPAGEGREPRSIAPAAPLPPGPAAEKRGPQKQALAAVGVAVLAIPATIYMGIAFLDDRKYYIISMLILLETMLPFVLMFEKRRPRARELVVVAVLCAIAVAGRAAFFMLPQMKPVVAVVVIAGVALGGEAGFLVGAMTGFVSNMLFGQGPWTPWQMFALGLIGLLAGLFFRGGGLRREKVPLCLFGGLAAVLIYGPLMNFSTIFLYQLSITKEMFYLVLFQGLPFDLLHGAATALFLWILSRPMLEKLGRVRVKYGLMGPGAG